MCFIDKVHLLDKHHSGMSHNAIGHEFNVNELTILNIRYGVFRKKLTQNKIMC